MLKRFWAWIRIVFAFSPPTAEEFDFEKIQENFSKRFTRLRSIGNPSLQVGRYVTSKEIEQMRSRLKKSLRK